MVTPECIERVLREHAIADRYSFNRPTSTNAPLPIETFTAVSDFLGRGASNFQTNYAKRAKDLLHGRGYLTTLDDVSSHRSSRHIAKALFYHGDATSACRQIELYVRSLLHSKSFGLVSNTTRNIDIVKDVLNLAPIYWIAEEIGLPLKTRERPHGVIFEQQADEAFKSIFSCVTFTFL
jgi:linoleate 10R-lipoxygenase